MGGGTGTKGGYEVGKQNDDAEGMCTSVASLEPDPRYSGCCSSIFRPGRVLRDIVVGSLVVIAIAVVIAVVFVVCFFFIPSKSSDGVPQLGEEGAFHGSPFEEGPYRGINEVEFHNNTRYDVNPQLERVIDGEKDPHGHDHEHGHDHGHDHEGHSHDHEGHDEHHHVGPVPESEPDSKAEPEPEPEGTPEPEPEVHHIPQASESEVTAIPTTQNPNDKEESSLPPLFELFSHSAPTEEHVEHTPEGSEGTLKELVVPQEQQTEEQHHNEEAHPEEAHGVAVAEATNEAPQGECQPRQLEMCSDLPHTLTSFPNWAGDQTEEDMQKTSLPFLRDVIVRSRCSPRAKEYSCAILEPPCTPEGTILPPCRIFCKSVASTCQEFITSRFSLSSAFDCDKFPDSSDPSVCFDMTHDSVPADNTTTVIPTPEEAEGTEATLLETTTLAEEVENTTASHCPELQCLDGTCISLSQVNDGVVDCPEGIDEEDFGELI